MDGQYSWTWVESRVAETSAVWNTCAGERVPESRRYTVHEQQQREQAWDEAADAVERELRQPRAHRTQAARRETQKRIMAAFARFSAVALDLDDDAIELLTHDFLPAGTRLARWARHFDPALSMPDIIQACRNAWTACGLQPLLGQRVELTPSILGYSMLYPYSDNFLDRENLPADAKLHTSRRFRERLRGEHLAAENDLETALWALIELIEGQYPRTRFPDVFDCLLAIHRAQEHSLSQVSSHGTGDDLLLLSCAKGGSSVLADACLARGWLTHQESRFAFDWGVLLQLGDDVQDVREDLERGSMTIFSQAAAAGERLDERVIQLLTFAEYVGREMEQLENGSPRLKALLRMSWRSLILMAVAASQEHFSPQFLAETEVFSPFRFAFLRERRRRLTGRQGVYAMLFEALIEAPEEPSVPLSDTPPGPSLSPSLELPPGVGEPAQIQDR
jgi:hypothetical protein